MGQKTLGSLPKKPLPNRRRISVAGRQAKVCLKVRKRLRPGSGRRHVRGGCGGLVVMGGNRFTVLRHARRPPDLRITEIGLRVAMLFSEIDPAVWWRPDEAQALVENGLRCAVWLRPPCMTGSGLKAV